MNETIFNFFSAFLGGIFMNCMPCILPLISIKIMGLLGTVHSPLDKGRFLSKAYSYIGGVFTFFTALAFTVLALKIAGDQVFLGTYMQSPQFLIIGFFVLVLIGMNFLGLIDFNLQFGSAEKLINKHSGLISNFLGGFFSALISISCTAPFIASAITFSLTQDSAVLILIFEAMALGFALPFIIASVFPTATLKIFPKPGIWMIRFKEIMSFPIFAFAGWFLFIITTQNEYFYVALAIVGLIFIAFTTWLYKSFTISKLNRLAILSLFLLVGAMVLPDTTPDLREEFSLMKFDDAIREHRKVFVAASASWCLTCQLNEKNIFNTKAFKKLLANQGILYYHIDFTKNNVEGRDFLSKYGQIGVPFYIVFNEKGDSKVLPPVMTSSYVEGALKHLD